VSLEELHESRHRRFAGQGGAASPEPWLPPLAEAGTSEYRGPIQRAQRYDEVAWSGEAAPPCPANRSRTGETGKLMHYRAVRERDRVRHVRGATAMVALAVLVFVASAGATPLDDLLFDLQFAPLDGQPAPAFTLAGLDGKPLSLAEFKDRVVLLYFWATW
jgi:hypothetical protein